MKYDFYSCPFEPDTGIPPCGDCPECTACSWLTIVRHLTQSEPTGESGT